MAAVFGAAGSRGKCMEIPESQAPSDLLPGAACRESAGLSSVKEHRAVGCGAELSCGSQESDILLCHYSAWLQGSRYMSPPQSHLPRPLNLKWPPHQPPSIPLPVRLLHSARCCRGPAFRSGPLLFLPRPCHLYVSREGSDSPIWVFQASEPPLVCGCPAPGPLGTDTAVSAGGAPTMGQTGGCGAAPPMEALLLSQGCGFPPRSSLPGREHMGREGGLQATLPRLGAAATEMGHLVQKGAAPPSELGQHGLLSPCYVPGPPSGPFLCLCPLEALFSQIVYQWSLHPLVPEHPPCPSRHFLDTLILALLLFLAFIVTTPNFTWYVYLLTYLCLFSPALLAL